MIPFNEALGITLRFALPRGTERVDLFHTLGRTLAEDICSDISLPPFNKSAMDGYVCRKSDMKNLLQIIEEIPAGSAPTKTIGANQCARIMTGGMVPDGANFVIMKEDVNEVTEDFVQCIRETSKDNICYKGEDVKNGDLVIKKGDVIRPAHIAILASVGCSNPLVYQIPSIAIISTGDELVEPAEKPGISKIRNSNGYQLIAQVQQLGIRADYLGIVPDDERSLLEVLSGALDKYDVTIISGGVSVGDFDFVPKILNQLNVNIQVHGMDVRPGKHQLFGERSNHFIFGMPGNPVSSFVQFEVLVKPFLETMMGKTQEQSILSLPLGEDYARKNGNQMIFVPVTFTEQTAVKPLEYHGSAHIHSYISAKGIMEIPQNILTLKKGDNVRVRPL